MLTKALVADAEAPVRAAVQTLLTSLGQGAVAVASADEARARLDSEGFSVCITDICLPGGGAEVVSAASARRPAIPVVAMTGGPEVDAALAAFRAGAVDVIPRPFHQASAATVVRRILDDQHRVSPESRVTGACLLGDHPATRGVRARIDQVAGSTASVLILGEDGTGKEAVARLIHAVSSRRATQFRALRFGARPDPSAETELLSLLQGPGGQAADNARCEWEGTIFVDDVACLSEQTQLKLARLLKGLASENGSRDRGLRLISASTRNLGQAVREGQFLKELYYQLNVIPIELPPLRERVDDIPALAEHFLMVSNVCRGRNVPSLSNDVMERLLKSPWEGNVCQLAMAVDQLVASAKDQAVEVSDLPPSLRTDVAEIGPSLLDLPPHGLDLRLLLSQLEDRLIGQALQRTGGNKNRAAELLGMNRTTLVEKLRRKNVA